MMTDKIMIDGVDVSGCNMKCKDGDCALYYADLSSDNNELEYGYECADNPNCYYKQLTRMQQELLKKTEECEKLKEKLVTLNELNSTIQRSN